MKTTKEQREEFLQRCGASGRLVLAQFARNVADDLDEALTQLDAWGAEVMRLQTELAEARGQLAEADDAEVLARSAPSVAISEWYDDVRDEWSEQIEAAFPTRSGFHDEYATAMRMVGNRRSKRALIALVNWLLVREAAAREEGRVEGWREVQARSARRVSRETRAGSSGAHRSMARRNRQGGVVKTTKEQREELRGVCRRVAALYIDPRGPYPGMPDVDCWDEARDARLYDGPWPVVAHPPCQLWVNFAALNFKRYGGAHNAPGNDRGCFAHALTCVRVFGGVLEHPADSNAWREFNLRKPEPGHWVFDTKMRGWVCEVWQSAYGHKARKRTWLFYAGVSKPIDADWSYKPGTHQIGWFDRVKPTLSKREASLTPPAFAEWLVSLARSARRPGPGKAER